MTRKFEKTFELSVPVERAWEVCTEPKELEAWYSPIVDEFDPKPGGRVRLRMEGMPDVEGEVLEVDRPRAIRWNEGPGLLPGTTEIAITFEETRTGTRVSITHSGFGEGDEWLAELDSHSHGWLQCIADLQLYLRTGVRFNRMFTWRSTTGALTKPTPAGVEVVRVDPGTFAERVGMRPGDLLVRLGRAPIFDRTDIWVVVREHGPGEELEATWVRDGELLSATSLL